MVLGDIVDAAQLLIKFGVQYIQDYVAISDNLMKAINALRCSITNIGENSWNIIAAAFWTAVGLGYAKDIAGYLDIGYEWICTCQEDANKLVRSWGVKDDGGRTDALLGTCSEKADGEKDKGKEKQKERVQARKDAGLVALKNAAKLKLEAEKQEEFQDVIKGEGVNGLEKRQILAYNAFREAS